LETDYQYDLLGNLIRADQWGGPNGSAHPRTRLFSYDYISRLIQAFNPESGWVCYGTTGATAANGSNCTNGDGYDGNGNLLHKTDSRGITVNYSYDSLNRILSRTSVNDPSNAVSSCYQYDITNTNGIGRLSAEWTQVGGCATSPDTYKTLQKIAAYDGMGRVTSEQQCVLGFCTSDTPPSAPAANCAALSGATGLTYCYDLAGNLLAYSNGLNSGSYPNQWVLFSQQFDNAGRLTSVSAPSGSWLGTSVPYSVFTANEANSYSAGGAPQKWTLGTNLNLVRTFDTRLRVTGETATQP
jgi:YD repeat-containing protein